MLLFKETGNEVGTKHKRLENKEEERKDKGEKVKEARKRKLLALKSDICCQNLSPSSKSTALRCKLVKKESL